MPNQPTPTERLAKLEQQLDTLQTCHAGTQAELAELRGEVAALKRKLHLREPTGPYRREPKIKPEPRED